MMTKLDQLPKIVSKKKKRIGRGYGSGKGGHTVGRGTKGQKARGKIGLTFTGTKAKKSLLKRLPLRRGKGKFKSLKPKPLIVNLKYLNLFKKGEVVNLENLIEKRIVAADEAKKFGVKILGDGDLNIALTVELPTSKKAAQKIIKAGGKITSKKIPLVAKEKKAKKIEKKASKKEGKK